MLIEGTFLLILIAGLILNAKNFYEVIINSETVSFLGNKYSNLNRKESKLVILGHIFNIICILNVGMFILYLNGYILISYPSLLPWIIIILGILNLYIQIRIRHKNLSKVALAPPLLQLTTAAAGLFVIYLEAE